MRGKVLDFVHGGLHRGITPAYAGKRVDLALIDSGNEDHPRICGEKLQSVFDLPEVSGSPPHMRGKAKAQRWAYGSVRITPAYAGKRALLVRPLTLMRDHPRICGEKRGMQISTPFFQGSPPHMRGKDFERDMCSKHSRITPAYAGKRKLHQRSFSACRDHPRICGEKRCNGYRDADRTGSPPHMRGKGWPPPIPCLSGRITPAYAGKSCL